MEMARNDRKKQRWKTMGTEDAVAINVGHLSLDIFPRNSLPLLQAVLPGARRCRPCPAGPTAANPLHTAAAGEWDRQTDGQTDRHRIVT